jgi:hypothetical protein
LKNLEDLNALGTAKASAHDDGKMERKVQFLSPRGCFRGIDTLQKPIVFGAPEHQGPFLGNTQPENVLTIFFGMHAQTFELPEDGEKQRLQKSVPFG